MSSTPGHRPAVLFTAFEPSGDAHAAPVIAALRRQAPELIIYALGGPLMAEAGAEMIDYTVSNAAMGLNALGKAREMRRHVAALRRWSAKYRVLAHIPVDSPAANFPICRVTRKTGARIIHLVAPQLWAWGPWRARKLRKLTDLVLCVLPFEPDWFTRREIEARFIGHFRINRELDHERLKQQAAGLPQGSPRIAIFPGSRAHEVKSNLSLLRRAYTELQARHAGASGVIVAANEALAEIVRERIDIFPTGLHMVTGQSDAAIAWCDLALCVSGTISLDITRQQKPMIGVYKVGPMSYGLAKLLLRTPHRLLPNIIAEREIVPEYVPTLGGVAGIVRDGSRVLQDSKQSAIQAEELARVCLRFAHKRPADEAAGHILKMIQDGTLAPKSTSSSPATLTEVG